MKNKIHTNINFGNGPNKNGRIYHAETIKSMVETFKSKNQVFLTNSPSSNPTVNISDVIGITESCYYDEANNRLELTFQKIKNDPILESSVNFKVIPCGTGSIDKSGVIKDYNLINFSVVANSAFEICDSFWLENITEQLESLKDMIENEL